MGKGDMKTKRGKTHRGTFGKSRPRKNQNIATKKEQSQATK
ncbi:30S ribosomal protein THX [Echinicola soli]|uniref:30S ribosomal protein THX n=1 Tax=Echinicola soli TaxID=2591634 RepID=A0A514CLH9_9BACT|nr:30S ribosomal protein THX [Echinicola soli]QDH80669.1 30S ribosomal protein THX [Echinicola soli]